MRLSDRELKRTKLFKIMQIYFTAFSRDRISLSRYHLAFFKSSIVFVLILLTRPGYVLNGVTQAKTQFLIFNKLNNFNFTVRVVRRAVNCVLLRHYLPPDRKKLRERSESAA